MAQKTSTYLVEYVYKNGKKGNAHLPAKSKEHAIERWLRSGNKQPYIDTITARIMVKDKVLHRNKWWWGECYTLILDGGDALVNVSVSRFNCFGKQTRQRVRKRIIEKCAENSQKTRVRCCRTQLQ